MSAHGDVYDGFDFSEASNKFLTRYENKNKNGSYMSRRGDLKDFEQWLDDDPTKAEWADLDGYITEQSNQLAPNTLTGRYTTLAMLYSYLEKAGMLGSNPWDLIEYKEYSDLMDGSMKDEASSNGTLPAISPEEKELLIEHAPRPKLRNRLAFRLLWHTAVRQGELANIKLENVDREKREIKVYSSKTEEWRTVGYGQGSVDRLLNSWLDYGERAGNLHAEESPYLLLSHQSPKMNQEVNKVVKQAAENAGIQEPLNTDDEGSPIRDANGHVRWRITAHAFRHGAALQYLRDGMNIRELQEYLGHKNLEQTMVYLDMLDNEVVERAQTIGQASDSFG